MLQQRKLKKHWLMMWKVLIQESWSMLKRRRRILYRINLVSSTTFLQNLRITYSNDLSCLQNYNFYILQFYLWSEPDLCCPFLEPELPLRIVILRTPSLGPQHSFLYTYELMKHINLFDFLLYCSLVVYIYPSCTQYPW